MSLLADIDDYAYPEKCISCGKKIGDCKCQANLIDGKELIAQLEAMRPYPDSEVSFWKDEVYIEIIALIQHKIGQ